MTRRIDVRRWLRLFLIAAVIGVLVVGVLYELATHVGRGWLQGEAFYQGRPTSFWRERCDEWISRFPDPTTANRYYVWGDVEHPSHSEIDGDLIMSPMAPPRTLWRRFSEPFMTGHDRMREEWPPDILLGYPGSEPVLQELAKDDRYRALAERSLRFAAEYRRRGHTE
jgi:hypothetical protein